MYYCNVKYVDFISVNLKHYYVHNLTFFKLVMYTFSIVNGRKLLRQLRTEESVGHQACVNLFTRIS